MENALVEALEQSLKATDANLEKVLERLKESERKATEVDKTLLFLLQKIRQVMEATADDMLGAFSLTGRLDGYMTLRTKVLAADYYIPDGLRLSRRSWTAIQSY